MEGTSLSTMVVTPTVMDLLREQRISWATVVLHMAAWVAVVVVRGTLLADSLETPRMARCTFRWILEVVATEAEVSRYKSDVKIKFCC